MTDICDNNNLDLEKINLNNIKRNKNKINKIIRISTNSINNIDEENELLKTFIYIYYYEKSLTEKNIFLNNNNETYYLINPDWLDNFKKLYSYNIIKNIIKSKKEINYNNIDSKIDSYFSIVREKIQIKKISFTEEMKKHQIIMPTLIGSKYNENIVHINNGIIFPSKIMNIIKNVYKELKFLKEKNLIFKDNYIYYVNKEKIIVGIYRKSALLKPKYVFTYNSIDLEKIEEEKMISSNINEYLKKRNLNIQPGYQILKNEKDEEIGSLINIYQKNESPIKRNISSNINSSSNNNKNLKYQTIDNENKLINKESHQNQKQEEKELIRDNNILNIQIKSLEQELKKREEQILNNNIEFEKLKKEYNLVLLSQNNKNNEIETLKIEEKNQNKEKEMEKWIKDFSELDNKFKKSQRQLSTIIRRKQKFLKSNINNYQRKGKFNR